MENRMVVPQKSKLNFHAQQQHENSSCVELTPITNEELSSHPKRNTKTIFPEKNIYSFKGILSTFVVYKVLWTQILQLCY